MIKVAVLLSILLGICSISNSQSSLNQELVNRYQRLDNEDAPGFFIGVIRSGDPILARSFGMANIEHRIPFSGKTVSDLGSVGKQLTIMGVLLLNEMGKLDLEDNILTHLPDLPEFNEVVKIKHLIYHTSGIPDVYALHSLKGFRYGDHISQSDAYRFIKVHPQVDFLPGSRYRYTNTGYMLLAEIIAKASGKGFEEFMNENIFLPLEMHQTYIMDQPGEIFLHMADSYVAQDSGEYTKLYDNSTLQGGGGVYASGYDALKWIDNFRTRIVGNHSIFRKMLTNATLNDGTKINYAGGINVDEYRGLKRYHHNGSSAGARTRLVYYPDHELGFIIKSNTPEIGYRDFSEMEDLIINSYLSEFTMESIEPSQETDIHVSSTSLPVEDHYSGHYFNDQLDLTIHANLQDKGIILSNFYYPFPLLQYSGDNSFSNGSNKVKFVENGTGVIDKMIIDTPRASGLEFIKKL